MSPGGLGGGGVSVAGAALGGGPGQLSSAFLLRCEYISFEVFWNLSGPHWLLSPGYRGP